jgi:peptidyl-prolyl cis-trans isomerase D
MLEFIRNRAQGFFAWLIVGGIIITFALFGINQYLSGGGDTSVAKVNGEGISQARLEQAYYQQRQRLEQMFGGKLPAMFSEKMIKQQVLSQLVAQEVMVQAAWDNGMRVSDAQLASIIRSIDAFKEDGKFSRSKYEQLLRNQGMTPGVFESRVRRDILSSQFESGYRDTAFVTKAETDNLLRLQKQQRTVGYLQVAIAPFIKAAEVSDEEVQDYYKNNQQRFMQPEQVKVDYLDLNVSDLMKNIEVKDETMRARYESQKINYTTPEERKASHILIRVKKDAPKEKDEAAKKKAEELLARIRNGEDFAELAKQESEDPGSAGKGGDLGFFGKGAMVPAFEDAAFSLKKGEVSDLVRSPFGYHIIKLTDIRGGEVQPFDKVKDKIRKEIQTERADQRFYDMADQLANLTYEHPESLQAASEELGLPVKTTDYFTRRGGTGIAGNPKVAEAAFSDEVLKRDNNSETIELGRNHLLVLRINDHQPEHLRPLEEVKDSIVSSIKNDKALEEAKKLASSLQEKVQNGESPESLATTDWTTWNEPKSVTRDDKSINGTIASTAFTMPAPADGGISSDTASLRSGDQAVVVLYQVTDGDPAKATEDERKKARDQLLSAKANAASDAVMAGIRGRMDITIKQ